MKNKFLHVALIVVSMTVICCVSAFAEMPYPEDLPPAPSDMAFPDYLIRRNSFGTYIFGFSRSDLLTLHGSGDIVSSGVVEPNSFGYFGYTLTDGLWVLTTPVTYGGNNLAFGPPSEVIYCNFNIYDAAGNLIIDGAPAPPPPPDPYESFWSDLKEVGTGVLGWAGNVATTITAEPVLLFTVGIFILGAAIGIFRRLLVRG